MNRRNVLLVFLAVVPVIFLVGCGTFEIGIEPQVIIEPDTPAEETSLASPSPTPTEMPTTEPLNNDEAAILATLAEKFGTSPGDLSVTITKMTESHAQGGIENGYFLAAKQNGQWVIVYDGQATPPCREIDFSGFPPDIVPECLNDLGQLIDRTAGKYVRVGEALAEYLGKQLGETNYSIVQDMGDHVLGYANQGYFLAAKVGEKWLIAFAGNGTPYCAQVDLHNFPPEMVPECMDANNNLVFRSGSVIDPTSSLLSLECGPGSPGATQGTLESVACNIQDGLRSRNTSALLGYMVDPFTIGYWLSEGVMGSPEEMMDTIHYLYNFHDENYVPRLTFTTDRALFPELDGRPLEGRFGPDVNVVEVIFSQGWGEGDQEALIFISQDSAGNFKWHGMLTGDLDVSVPGS